MPFRNWIYVLRTCNLPQGQPMDRVSKWLIITRACVISMTLISALIGGLLAGMDGHFSWSLFLLVAIGLILAHASNNMVNDLFDVRAGVDTEDYPRAHYAPHPLLDHLVSPSGLVAAILLCNAIDFIIAVFLSWTRGWPVFLFAVVGLAMSVFYVAPPIQLKKRGLGELAILSIWGPLIVAGTYFVMAKDVPLRIWVSSLPYGIGVSAVLMGKHLDKLDKDSAKGIRTLPVLLGESGGKRAMQLMVWSFYLLLTGLVGAGWLPPCALLTLLTIPRAIQICSILDRPTPETPAEAFGLAANAIPQDLRRQFDPDDPTRAYPLWPLWYVAWGVWWVRWAGGALVLGLLVEAVIYLVP
jgi:1,4-dihydroxy-2-naphthoate octaprenyltransferase